MEEEYEIPYFGVDEDEERLEISENQFLVNLMAEKASFIIDIFEKFLKEKKFVNSPAILCKGYHCSIEEEVIEVLEWLLHEARSEFEE